MQDIHLQTVTVFPALGQRNAPRSHVHSAVAAMTLVALVAAMTLVALVAAMTLVALVAAMTLVALVAAMTLVALVAAMAVVVLVARLVMFHLAMVWVPHTGVFFGGRPVVLTMVEVPVVHVVGVVRKLRFLQSALRICSMTGSVEKEVSGGA